MYKNRAVTLIIINGVVFLIQLLLGSVVVPYTVEGNVLSIDVVTYYGGLIPYLVVEKGFLWQLISYMFLHSTSGFAHILFNMYALFIFGVPIERLWGSKRFLVYYFICGIGAGLAIFSLAMISGGINYYIPTIGASGAVFGILLAFGVLFPDVEILLFFIIPIKARTLVILYGGLELFLELSGTTDSISHIGHLGGLVTGIVYFIITRKHAIRYKTKGFVAQQIKKESVEGRFSQEKQEIEYQKAILRKLQTQGESALTDDEIQYIRYKEIMVDTNDVSCDADMFGSGKCENCVDRDVCFVKTVKQLLE